MSEVIDGPVVETPQAVTTDPVTTPPVETPATGEEVKTEAVPKVFTQEEVDAIAQKERKRAEAIAERRALKAYKETLERIIPAQQPAQQRTDERPTRANFASDDDYVEAMTDWKIGQRDSASRQHQQQEQQKTILNKTEKLYAEASKIAGFERESFDELPLTQTIAAAVIDSDVAPKLMAYLASNPDEVDRIAQLSPTRQAAAIGRLEEKVSSAPKISNAPPPLKPVGARGSAANSDVSRMSMDEYAEHRKKQGAGWARR